MNGINLLNGVNISLGTLGVSEETMQKARTMEKFCDNWNDWGHTLDSCELKYESYETKCKLYVCKKCGFLIRVKPIKDFENYYEVSDNGKVFSCERKVEGIAWNNKKYTRIIKRKE